MIKLSRLSLSELEVVIPCFENDALRDVVGGGATGSYAISGGNIVNYEFDGEKYCVFYGDNGDSFVFRGVNVGSGSMGGGVAYQLNGTIHLGDSYSSFDVDDMLHEYGHYMQQILGSFGSYVGVAANSLWATIRQKLSGNYDYYSNSSEQKASLLGQIYMDYYYPGSGHTATGYQP